MPTWKLTLEYDGAPYCGWQRQASGVSVQGVVEDALRQLLSGDEVHVVASGRTDAGVHARGQVVSFATERMLRADSYLRGLNTLLPPSVAVRHAEAAPQGFDANRWALSKRYTYRLLIGRARSPLRQPFVWQLYNRLDVEAMRAAAALLVGTRDFASFRGAQATSRTTIRTLTAIELAVQDDELRLTFEGTGFLKQMVRNLVGTLVEVGQGRRAPESMRAVLAACDRRAAGRTAPAQGLCLEQVRYDLEAGPPDKTVAVVVDEDD